MLTGVIAFLPRRLLAALLLLLVAAARLPAHEGTLGLFTEHTDIGAPKRAGTVAYDAAKGIYVVGGGGANMWFAKDSFHFVWKKVEGDIALAADISFQGTGGDPHRKAVLMIRQTLDHDAAHADVAFHGDGLTSLQFREAVGDITREVQTVITAPKRLRLEKVGDHVYMSLAGADGVLAPSGCSVRLPFKGPFYLGIGVCAHNDAAFETAVFSNVVIGPPSKEVIAVRSSLEFVYAASGDRRSVWHTKDLIEAPTWTTDGAALEFTVGGRRHRVVLATGARPEPVGESAGTASVGATIPRPSPDGRTLARLTQVGEELLIQTSPVEGGAQRTLAKMEAGHGPLHPPAWSPDGTKIAYVRYQPGQKN